MPDSFIEDAATTPGLGAADELAKFKTLTNALLESSSEGIIVLNRFGIVEHLNQVAQHLLGYDSEAALGKSINDIFNAFDPVTDEPIELSS
jgi:PAS domain S-box-containing protein